MGPPKNYRAMHLLDYSNSLQLFLKYGVTNTLHQSLLDETTNKPRIYLQVYELLDFKVLLC